MKKRGIGVDLVEVYRIQRAVTRWENRFLHRVFLPQELAYCLSKTVSSPHLAVRFAAKEAAYKALALPQLRWQDFWVKSEGGVPYLGYSPKVSEMRPNLELTLSLSHTHEHAVAVVWAEWEEKD